MGNRLKLRISYGRERVNCEHQSCAAAHIVKKLAQLRRYESVCRSVSTFQKRVCFHFFKRIHAFVLRYVRLFLELCGKRTVTAFTSRDAPLWARSVDLVAWHQREGTHHTGNPMSPLCVTALQQTQNDHCNYHFNTRKHPVITKDFQDNIFCSFRTF